MKQIRFSLIAALAVLPAPLLARAAGPASANQLPRQMAAKLEGARSFSFTADRRVDAALRECGNVPETARITVAVQRPK